MNYKRVSLQDGTDVQYVGVYVLKWNFDWGQPEVGFVENDYTLQDALDELDYVQFIDNRGEDATLAKDEVIEILNKLVGNNDLSQSKVKEGIE